MYFFMMLFYITSEIYFSTKITPKNIGFVHFLHEIQMCDMATENMPAIVLFTKILMALMPVRNVVL